MRDDNPALEIFFIALLCLVAAMGGGHFGRKELRNEAVKAGVAEWRATPEGDVTFHRKEPKP